MTALAAVNLLAAACVGWATPHTSHGLGKRGYCLIILDAIGWVSVLLLLLSGACAIAFLLQRKWQPVGWSLAAIAASAIAWAACMLPWP